MPSVVPQPAGNLQKQSSLLSRELGLLTRAYFTLKFVDIDSLASTYPMLRTLPSMEHVIMEATPVPMRVRVIVPLLVMMSSVS